MTSQFDQALPGSDIIQFPNLNRAFGRIDLAFRQILDRSHRFFHRELLGFGLENLMNRPLHRKSKTEQMPHPGLPDFIVVVQAGGGGGGCHSRSESRALEVIFGRSQAVFRQKVTRLPIAIRLAAKDANGPPQEQKIGEKFVALVWIRRRMIHCLIAS